MNGYIEVNPLPERCVDCKEDCFNCDYALDRFQKTKEQEIKQIIRCKITHIKLLNRQIKDLKEDIYKLEKLRNMI